MKQLLLSIFILVSSLQVSAQKHPETTKGPEIKFAEDSYDFGVIKEGVTARHVFKFRNTGNVPLLIQFASDACACASHEWTKAPVMPGKTGEIIIIYQTAGRLGQFSKDVFIHSNAVPGTPLPELHYKGYVVKASDSTAK